MRTIRVASATRTATASILLASILLCSTALAVQSGWTGTYLRAADNAAIHYNSETGQVYLVRSGIPGPLCTKISPLYERCGQCVYVPSKEGWRSNVTQFRWGRCVNADLTDPDRIRFRRDVRMEDGYGIHEVRGQIEFVDGNGDVIEPAAIELPFCDSRTVPIQGQAPMTFSICAGLAWETPFPTSWPEETEKICLSMELWYVEPGNAYLENEGLARPCRTIAS